jgi:hypothetical protein
MIYKAHGLYLNIACTLHCGEINLQNKPYINWRYTLQMNKISYSMFRHSIGALLKEKQARAIYSFKDIKLRLFKLPDESTYGVPKHVGDFVYLGIGYSHVNYH